MIPIPVVFSTTFAIVVERLRRSLATPSCPPSRPARGGHPTAVRGGGGPVHIFAERQAVGHHRAGGHPRQPCGGSQQVVQQHCASRLRCGFGAGGVDCGRQQKSRQDILQMHLTLNDGLNLCLILHHLFHAHGFPKKNL